MCDAACIKIIINTGFMAALAPSLADHVKFGDPVQKAAAKLGGVANLYLKMLAAAGYRPDPAEFDGCEQAKTLVAWITAGKQPPDAVKQIEKWTANLWASIAELAAGKPPA